MARKAYSNDEKAEILAALDANGGNLKRTARETGLPINTLRRWRDGQGINEEVIQLRPQKRGILADMYEDEINAIFVTLPTKREEATYQQLATAAGIFTDKMRLLRDLPTEIIGILPAFLAALKDAGLDAAQVFNDLISEAAQLKHEQTAGAAGDPAADATA
jgi:lambda repressor-like predicted transcriptional regulator